MRKTLLFFFIVISINLTAQKLSRHTPVITKGWYLSFNPHSVLELDIGAVGLGIGYRFNKHIEFWTELNYLYKGIPKSEYEFDHVKGIRNLTSFKYYYYNKHGMFVGAEFRLKNFSFHDNKTFINYQTHDTLKNINYKTINTLTGGAVFWGKRTKLTGNGKFELEFNVGIGIKYRSVIQKNIPQGYSKVDYRHIDTINFEPDFEEEGEVPYIPAALRLIYHF